ncbi:hypothetical protein BUALT_Bualt04G0121900 [Buddleja alternifolia]|uniref:Protein Lines C-terminal domain-containing protein n=1 Tax=Buddleja alternifolia TaxID=168488 RepID=A0AAV6XQG3_9LAMI|nr:hypothetical protein BUALT_Bualt04G0121900 [Buddleja alternifolia]
MFLLAVKSRYVQHLAGNTLIAVAEFVVTSEMGWDDFMHLLCFCLELAICNSLASSSRAEASETRYPDYDPSILKLLKLKLKIANWFVVAAVFRILRNILKYLKQDYNDKIMKAYLDSVSSLISNLPLDILRKIYGGRSTDALKSSDKDVLLNINDVQPREMSEFFGNFNQFLCSLVAQSSCLEDGEVFSSVIFKIINLVPKLTAWYRGDFQSAYHVRISHYFRHKVLDDILFEMLLQLLRVPLYLDRQIIKDEPIAEVKNRPILYDHQVLLDYLISKDIGSSCAVYLLRSLRIVCDSWNLFVGFPGVGEGSGQLCPKRQKVSVDCKDFKGEFSPLLPLKDGGISTVEKEHNEGYAHGRNYTEPFVAGRDCLASLRSSINSLNQKDLFPYNPQVLLRRLMRFEELCADIKSSKMSFKRIALGYFCYLFLCGGLEINRDGYCSLSADGSIM